MAKTLDLIGSFAEGALSDELLYRIAPLEPSPHPLGRDHTQPCWGIFAAPVNWEPGWIVLNTTTYPPHQFLDGLNDDELDRILRLALLLGVSWAAIEASVARVCTAQESAVAALPNAIYRAPIEGLRNLRPMINEADPGKVSLLLRMMDTWSRDVGGTAGATFV